MYRDDVGCDLFKDTTSFSNIKTTHLSSVRKFW